MFPRWFHKEYGSQGKTHGCLSLLSSLALHVLTPNDSQQKMLHRFYPQNLAVWGMNAVLFFLFLQGQLYVSPFHLLVIHIALLCHINVYLSSTRPPVPCPWRFLFLFQTVRFQILPWLYGCIWPACKQRKNDIAGFLRNYAVFFKG